MNQNTAAPAAFLLLQLVPVLLYLGAYGDSTRPGKIEPIYVQTLIADSPNYPYAPVYVGDNTYRWHNDLCFRAFWPLEQIHRRLQPAKWDPDHRQFVERKFANHGDQSID